MFVYAIECIGARVFAREQTSACALLSSHPLAPVSFYLQLTARAVGRNVRAPQPYAECEVCVQTSGWGRGGAVGVVMMVRSVGCGGGRMDGMEWCGLACSRSVLYMFAA